MVCLTLLALLAYTAISVLDGSVDTNICLGKPQTFSCEVPNQGSLTRLEWRIDFESPFVTNVIQQYAIDDPEGGIFGDDRLGIKFEFNLTSNSLASLISVMTVTVNDVNAVAFIENATVNCGDEAYPKVLHANEGPPSQRIVLTNNLMSVQWNPVNVADHYIISISPLINDSEFESTLMTSNTTIQLPLQHNQDYNISVMASNCAGNSTATKISVRVGYCTFSTSELGKINFKNNSSTGGVEGSQISFFCHDNRNEPVVAMCMKNGSWSPDLHTYKCQNDKEKDIASEQLYYSKMATWHVITITLIAVVLLAIISAVIVLAVYRKHSSLQQKIKIDHPNYTDLPSSEMNENQELGIYSLLHPEEQVTTRLQSTDQAAVLVYADVGSTLPHKPKANANISLQLDDDCVQYADIKHHQTSEVHSRECNSHTGTPVDLDSLLIHLRSEVTPKWHEFGETVGIPEEMLEKYSNYPPEECIVEVFDYWLRNYPSTDKPTWKDVADALTKMDLHQLANSLLQSGAPMPVDMNAVPEHLLQLNTTVQSSQDEVPPPLPPKMADLDEEMKSSGSSRKNSGQMWV